MVINRITVVRLLALALVLAGVPCWATDAKAKATPTPAALVDLNTASEKDLETLPGVGAATAKKIIAGRPYSSVDDLAKAGVSASTITKLKPKVTVAGAATAPASAPAAPAPAAKAPAAAAAAAAASAGPVDLNTASEKELETLPGVGSATAKKIIAGRPYSRVDDLSKAGVSASTIAKLKPQATVGAAAAPAAATAPAAPAAAAATPVPAKAAAAPAPPSAKPAPAKTPKPPTAAASAPPAVPPQPGMVWVNKDTKVFHREGDRWYGKTKHGDWMTEEDAIKAGYHEAKPGGKPSPTPGN